MTTALIVIIILVLLVLVAVAIRTGVKVVQQYELGIVFRFGRARGWVRKPGLCFLLPFGIERIRKVNMQIITMPVPNQEGITKDNVTLSVDAVVYFRVVDPFKAVVNVQDYIFAVSQVAHTSLRSVIGHSDMDELLSERERVNNRLREIIDAPTEGPWGVKIERVEVRDVSLPEAMKRSMSRQAEAERERRARVIIADGEFQASTRLAQAGRALSADPSALQLRLLQTVVEVAAEKNSTLIVPFPVELLRFLDAQARVATRAADQAASEEISLPSQPSQPQPSRASPDGDLTKRLPGPGTRR